MAMTAFYTRFEDLAFKEMRACTVSPGKEVPADDYGFLEFYCDDNGCNCHRVIIKVLGRGSGDKTWATINYGWEKAEFYQRWAGSGTSLMEANMFSRPVLDPLNPQSPHAEFFLSLFEEMIKDKAYVDRLKRHYEMFRKPKKR